MATDLSDRLLAHLRGTLQTPDLTYSEPPTAITGGFETLPFGFRLSGAPDELSGPLILRVFREENPWVTLSSPERVRFETAIQNTVASLGYPAPRILHGHPETDVSGGAFLIMERIAGRLMLDFFFRPSPLWLRLPAILAEIHAKLHELDPQLLVQAIEAAGVPSRVLAVDDWVGLMMHLIDVAQLDGLRPGMQWLHANSPRQPQHPVICHGDFHPLNILMAKGAVSGVIDWPSVRIADPAYDVGATIAILTQGPVAMPRFLHPVVNWFRRGLVRRYLSAYLRIRALDLDAVRYYEALRCFSFLIEAGQQRQADLGVVARPDKPTAFASPPVVNAVVRRVREISGITLTLPPPTS